MKSKILSVILIGFLSLGTFQAFASNENPNIITETITLSPLQIMESESYTKVSFSVPTSILEEEGKPILPQITKSYSLPFGTIITSVDVVYSEQQETRLTNPIQPGKSSISLLETDSPLDSYMISSLYDDLLIYPQQQFEFFTSVGRKDNNPLLFVTVLCFPVQYIPKQNIISYCMDIEITIKYIPPQEPITYSDEFDLVVITPNEFSSALQPLITHKNEMGIKSFLKTTEEIYSEYSGVDKPEQIKYFIKEALDSSGIDFVLLVGGIDSKIYATSRDDENQGTKDWHLPVRYANIKTSTDPGYISDLYYADIYDAKGNFSSWDTNKDGLFASYKPSNRDMIDLVPEVAVGRLACCNVDEVQTVVNKIINYETTAYGSAWEKNFVLVGGDTFEDTSIIAEGEIETQKSYDYVAAKGYKAIKIFASNRESGGMIPEPEDIVLAISEGAGFVHFAGHGSPEIWNTHWVGGPFERSERAEGLHWYNMIKMTNENKQPIVVIGGCHNSQFNVTMTSCLNYYINKIYEITGIEAFKCYEGNVVEPLPECFSWFFVSQENGGAIASLGNTGTGYGATGNSGDQDGDGIDDPDCVEVAGGYLETLFFKSIGVKNVSYVGNAWQDAITNFLLVYPGMKDQQDAQTVEQWVLLGDPSLRIGGYQ